MSGRRTPRIHRYAGGLIALAMGAAGAAPAAVQACPEDLDQTYEWRERGNQLNGLRAALLEGVIADDPGPDAPLTGRQRIGNRP